MVADQSLGIIIDINLNQNQYPGIGIGITSGVSIIHTNTERTPGMNRQFQCQYGYWHSSPS